MRRRVATAAFCVLRVSSRDLVRAIWPFHASCARAIAAPRSTKTSPYFISSVRFFWQFLIG